MRKIFFKNGSHQIIDFISEFDDKGILIKVTNYKPDGATIQSISEYNHKGHWILRKGKALKKN